MKKVKVGLSRSEKDFIKGRAIARNLEVSAYCRLILVGYDPGTIDKPASYLSFRGRYAIAQSLLRDYSRLGRYTETEVQPLRVALAELEEFMKSRPVEEIEKPRLGDRETVLSLRFNDDDLERIDKDAQLAGQNRGLYVRSVLANRLLPTSFAEVPAEINKSLDLLAEEIRSGECDFDMWKNRLQEWAEQ